MFDTYTDIFSQRAHLYQRAMTNYPDARRAEFLAMMEPLRTGQSGFTICDMPSGGGYLSSYVPENTAYVAVEPTAAFASLFAVGKNKRIVIAETSDTPFVAGEFDAVISLAGLHHEPDKSQIFLEISRILKYDGLAIIADVAAGSQEDKFLNGYVHANSDMGHDGRFLDSSLASTVEQSGMLIISDKLIPVPWKFASSSDAARFARDLFAINTSLPEIEEALGRIVGLRDQGSVVEINWNLRRLVCQKRRVVS